MRLVAVVLLLTVCAGNSSQMGMFVLRFMLIIKVRAIRAAFILSVKVILPNTTYGRPVLFNMEAEAEVLHTALKGSGSFGAISKQQK